MEKALSLQPNNPVFHHNIAGIYSRQGFIPKAIQHFRRAIELKPDYAEAYQGLTESKSCKDDWALLNQIQKQLNVKSVPDSRKVYLHFAAGKICADSKNYDDAFFHYQQANRFKNVTFDVKADRQETKSKIKFFNKDWVAAHKEFGLYSHTPIFIVGMPRSGTTLAEQILASHSDVFGAGELNDISSIIETLRKRTKRQHPDPFFLLETVDTDLLGFGLSYLKRLKELSNNHARVINKHPLNFKHIGLILLMFPNAKIIHTIRNPLDTCLSCFFQNFTKGQHYSFNLEHLAAFFNHYKVLINHWETLYPGKIFSFSYERLIFRQETITKELLNFCDLKWENQCLSFYETKRNVTTASKFQVRQPLYRGSLKRWRHYEAHLQPLIKALASTSL